MVGTNLDIWHSEDEPRLGAVLSECWHLLSDGASDPQHDFHTTALATTHAGFGCTLRTVVLRKVDPAARELWFYTDLRSRKIGADGNELDPAAAAALRTVTSTTPVATRSIPATTTWCGST